MTTEVIIITFSYLTYTVESMYYKSLSSDTVTGGVAISHQLSCVTIVQHATLLHISSDKIRHKRRDSDQTGQSVDSIFLDLMKTPDWHFQFLLAFPFVCDLIQLPNQIFCPLRRLNDSNSRLYKENVFFCYKNTEISGFWLLKMSGITGFPQFLILPRTEIRSKCYRDEGIVQTQFTYNFILQ